MRCVWFWCVVLLIVLLPVTTVHATLKLHPWRWRGEANGADTVNLNATVTDANGAPLEGVTVYFQASAGSITPSEAMTPWYGIVQVTLTAPTTPQRVTVTATCSAGSDTCTVEFVEPGSLEEWDAPCGPGVVSVDAEPDAIPADGASSTELVALVLDANENPVPGVPVIFRVSSGTLVSDQAITDANGEARTTLIASTTPGEVDVYAYAMGDSYEGGIVFEEVRSSEEAGSYSSASTTQPGQLSHKLSVLFLQQRMAVVRPGRVILKAQGKKPKFYVNCSATVDPPTPGLSCTLKITNTNSGSSTIVGMEDTSGNGSTYYYKWDITEARGTYTLQAFGGGTQSSPLTCAIGKGLQICLVSVLCEGAPYKWGGVGPNSFDCSGLVQFCHSKVGIKTPRVASAQQAAATPATDPVPGDLVFFKGTYGPNPDKVTHVAIFLGMMNVKPNANGAGINSPCLRMHN